MIQYNIFRIVDKLSLPGNSDINPNENPLKQVLVRNDVYVQTPSQNTAVIFIGVNTIPLIGVVFLNWDAFSIVLLYWAENLVIGFYNVARMVFVKVEHPIQHLGKLFSIPFFIIHFEGFTSLHGFFVLAVFGKDQGEMLHGDAWPGFLFFVQLLINVIRQVHAIISPDMKLALMGLFISHGISFVHNYLVKGKYAREKIKTLMGKPYSRILVMHVAVIVGGFLSMALGSPAVLLFVLVILKTSLDVRFHLREHGAVHS